jgi:RHS repeat-associated protein
MLLGLLFGREAQAFYNPSTGRWLSRDPIGEPGHHTLSGSRRPSVPAEAGNLFCMAGNSPVTKVDLLGLSAKDVTAIIEQFKATMKRMCDQEQRCDCLGIGPLKDLKAAFGKPWGRGWQAGSLLEDLLKLKLDDGWDMQHRSYFTVFPFRHQDVEVVPTDANSGNVTSIVVDTFEGCYTVNKREPFIIPPLTVFWLNTHYSQCYTCNDFKNWK